MITAGVLGSPISHSLSPLLHNTVYDFLGIKASYVSYEVQSGTLQKFLDVYNPEATYQKFPNLLMLIFLSRNSLVQAERYTYFCKKHTCNDYKTHPYR